MEADPCRTSSPGDNCGQLVSLQVSLKGNWRKRLAFMNAQRATWELKENKAPTSTPGILEEIEAVLRNHGVIVFASPTPGARLVT
jgi:hypothetical protein